MYLTDKQGILLAHLRLRHKGEASTILIVPELARSLGWTNSSTDRALTALIKHGSVEHIETKVGRGGGKICRIVPETPRIALETPRSVSEPYHERGNEQQVNELQAVLPAGEEKSEPNSSPAPEKGSPPTEDEPSQGAGANSSRSLSDAAIQALRDEELERLTERGLQIFERRRKHKVDHLLAKSEQWELERDRRRVDRLPPEKKEKGWLADLEPEVNDENLRLLHEMDSLYGPSGAEREHEKRMKLAVAERAADHGLAPTDDAYGLSERGLPPSKDDGHPDDWILRERG